MAWTIISALALVRTLKQEDMNYTMNTIMVILMATGLSAFIFSDAAVSAAQPTSCKPANASVNLHPWKYNLPEAQPCATKVELGFYINGVFGQYTTQQQLIESNTIMEIIPDYPKSWIVHYKAVHVRVNHNGDVQTSSSKDILFTQDQKDLLSTVDVGDQVSIEVRYLRPNSVSNEMEERTMNFDMFVKPETEASYEGGLNELIQILEESSELENKDRLRLSQQDPITRIAFTINEKGRAENILVVESSRVRSLDEQLINALKQMPNWNPAQDARGNAVAQSFEFLVGKPGC